MDSSLKCYIVFILSRQADSNAKRAWSLNHARKEEHEKVLFPLFARDSAQTLTPPENIRKRKIWRLFCFMDQDHEACFFLSFKCLRDVSFDFNVWKVPQRILLVKGKKKRLGSYVLCKPSTGIAFPAGSKRVITSGRVANKNSGSNSSLSHGVRDIQFLFLTIYTLKSGCIFSILFSIHFLKCWREEFVWQSRTSLVGDHFLYSRDPRVWFRGDIVRRN